MDRFLKKSIESTGFDRIILHKRTKYNIEDITITNLINKYKHLQNYIITKYYSIDNFLKSEFTKIERIREIFYYWKFKNIKLSYIFDYYDKNFSNFINTSLKEHSVNFNDKQNLLVNNTEVFVEIIKDFTNIALYLYTKNKYYHNILERDIDKFLKSITNENDYINTYENVEDTIDIFYIMNNSIEDYNDEYTFNKKLLHVENRGVPIEYWIKLSEVMDDTKTLDKPNKLVLEDFPEYIEELKYTQNKSPTHISQIF